MTQKIFNRFQNVLVVNIAGQKWKCQTIGELVILKNRNKVFKSGKTALLDRWRIINDKLHYLQKTIVTGEIYLRVAE